MMHLANPLSLPPAFPGAQRIYLIRHGETDYNRQNIVQGGGVDSDLNALGRKQAAAFHAMYSQVPFTAVYATGLKRTRQTLAPFAAQGYNIQQEPRLNEMGWGVLEGATHDQRVEGIFQEALKAWAEGDLDFTVPGGESPIQVRDRAVAAVRDIVLAHPEGNLLICTHGRTMRILLAELLGYGLTRMQWFKHANTALNLLVRSDTMLNLHTVNDTTHLEPGAVAAGV